MRCRRRVSYDECCVHIEWICMGARVRFIWHWSFGRGFLRQPFVISYRADSSFLPNQWETSLQCNAVSHWLGKKLESALLHNVDFLLSLVLILHQEPYVLLPYTYIKCKFTRDCMEAVCFPQNTSELRRYFIPVLSNWSNIIGWWCYFVVVVVFFLCCLSLLIK